MNLSYLSCCCTHNFFSRLESEPIPIGMLNEEKLEATNKLQKINDQQNF